MSAPVEPHKATVEPGPESPTTARPLEMDDDDVQETGVLGEDGSQKPTTTAAAATGVTGAPTGEEAPPPKPPRPVTEQQKNEQMLQEAFPAIEASVIKAVLIASGGRIEPAFNALLGMTDPDAVQEEQPPPQPPRPVQPPTGPSSTARSQLEADEEYARQLAQHYENVGAYEARTSNREAPYHSRTRQQTGLKPNEMYGDDREHSFLDDDLPVIRDSLKKGFLETQTKVNTWFTNLKKKIDEEWNEDEDPAQRPGGSNAFMGRPSRDGSRRSGDYDNDPELLSDDFAGMKFHSDGTPAQGQRQPTNPNLFKPPPPSTSPKPGGGRKVAFQENIDDIDAYNASPKLPPKDNPPGSGGKASKWQPLSAVDPSPIAENDPFSLGDSEDEKDHKDKKGGEIKLEDSERVRSATAEAMADSLVEDKSKGEGKKE